MEISIIKLMDKDHKRIKELLSVFDNNLSIENFDRFKWNLEKHFFIEEKVIFNSQELEEISTELQNILNEHSEIINSLNIIEESLSNNKKPDISEMKQLLLSHAKFEDETFYPKLDEILNDLQKTEIQDKIKDIILQ